MKKTVIIVLVVVLTLVITGIGVANDISTLKKLDRFGSSMKVTAEYTGMGYLGFVNVTDISRNSGYVYNGPAIVAELLNRAGLDGRSDTWTSIVGDHGDVCICKLTVYEDGQENVPEFQKKVKAEYLYGEIF